MRYRSCVESAEDPSSVMKSKTRLTLSRSCSTCALRRCLEMMTIIQAIVDSLGNPLAPSARA